MAIDAHTDGLTAQRIVKQCEAMAGHPNLHLVPEGEAAGVGTEPTTEAMVDGTPAYIWLNEIIQQAHQTGDWPYLETGATVNISARENALPTDYWRQRFDHGLFILEGGNRHGMIRCTPERWHKEILATPATPARPTHYYIDRARQSIFVDPSPDVAYPSCELHYQRSVRRITAITQIPGQDPNSAASFPYPQTLIDMLLERYYLHQNDSRLPYQAQKADKELQRVRQSIYEPFDSEPSIQLDSRIFVTPRYN